MRPLFNTKQGDLMGLVGLLWIPSYGATWVAHQEPCLRSGLCFVSVGFWSSARDSSILPHTLTTSESSRRFSVWPQHHAAVAEPPVIPMQLSCHPASSSRSVLYPKAKETEALTGWAPQSSHCKDYWCVWL